MLSNPRSSPVHAPAPGVIPDAIMAPLSNGSPIATDSGSPTATDPTATDSGVAPAQPSTAASRETRRERSRRKAHRSRLHGYAILTVALVALLIALAASNTAHVKVNWVLGSSDVSVVWLVLFAAIVGWLLGLIATAAFHWRTRAPRRGGGTS